MSQGSFDGKIQYTGIDSWYFDMRDIVTSVNE